MCNPSLVFWLSNVLDWEEENQKRKMVSPCDGKVCDFQILMFGPLLIVPRPIWNIQDTLLSERLVWARTTDGRPQDSKDGRDTKNQSRDRNEWFSFSFTYNKMFQANQQQQRENTLRKVRNCSWYSVNSGAKRRRGEMRQIYNRVLETVFLCSFFTRCQRKHITRFHNYWKMLTYNNTF